MKHIHPADEEKDENCQTEAAYEYFMFSVLIFSSFSRLNQAIQGGVVFKLMSFQTEGQ